MDNPNHIHSFVDTVVPASCQGAGYTLHRCACGYEYKDQFKAQGAHHFETVDRMDPTCLDTGIERVRCSQCGITETRKIPVTPANHNSQIQPTPQGCQPAALSPSSHRPPLITLRQLNSALSGCQVRDISYLASHICKKVPAVPFGTAGVLRLGIFSRNTA